MRSRTRRESCRSRTRTSASLAGVAPPVAREPNRTTATMFGSLARACSAALRTRRTAAGTSRNVTFAESEDGVGIGDGLGRIGGREVVARHPAIEAVGVAGGNVVPVEPARRIEQRRRGGGPLPQARRQRNDGVAPGFAAE